MRGDDWGGGMIGVRRRRRRSREEKEEHEEGQSNETLTSAYTIA